MPDLIKPDFSDVKKWIDKLPELTPLLQKELRQAHNEAAAFTQAFLANYPPPRRGFRMPFRSDRQRRFLFWALRSGVITVPYRRTGALGKSWAIDMNEKRDNINTVVGNIRPYVVYVQDEGRQALVHKGRWPTVQALFRTPRKKIVGFFEAAVRRALTEFVRK